VTALLRELPCGGSATREALVQGEQHNRKDDDIDGAQGRRSFLKKAGVGVAVAWTAPVLVSNAASAGPGTGCLPGGIQWGTTEFTRADSGTITTGVLPLTAYPLAAEGFVLDVDDTGNTYASTGPQPSGIDALFPRPPETFSFHVQMNATGTGPITITFSFFSPVTNLAFSILDIDRTGTNTGFNDRINVTASNGGSAVAGTGTPVSSPPTVVLIPDVEFEGSTDVPSTSDDGDVAFSFAGPLDEVVIVYSRSGANLRQGIGISNLTYTC
jgi:hypothetical protein